MDQFVDIISSKEVEIVTQALGDLFFGCNIPFSVVESTHFKNFIKTIRPAYESYIPSRKVLSTTILDDAYERMLQQCRSEVKEDVVILIDGWRNSSSNTKTVTSMVHTTNGKCMFIDSWNLTNQTEDFTKLLEIVEESVEICNAKYNLNVYAIVSDNASNMKKMGRNSELWHSTCSSHTGNLLCKDVLDTSLKQNIHLLIKNFKQPDVEQLIVQEGGSRTVTIADTRWCTYRDASVNIIGNIPIIRKLILDKTFRKPFPEEIRDLIFNFSFFEDLEEFVRISNPVCELINICQKPDTSIADAAKLWLDLDVEDSSSVQVRKKMALNIYALCALYLHPKYHEFSKTKLSKDQLKNITDFFIEELDKDGLEELAIFDEKKGIHAKLMQKGLDPLCYWRVAQTHCPSLAKLALKLLKMPASSAQIERLFSNWSFVHSPIRNRLTFERSKKLVHIYHTLKNNDTLNSDEY